MIFLSYPFILSVSNTTIFVEIAEPKNDHHFLGKKIPLGVSLTDDDLTKLFHLQPNGGIRDRIARVVRAVGCPGP